MTSQRRRRRKKAEKQHRVVRRCAPYEPALSPLARATDERLISELSAAVDRYLDLSEIELERAAASESIAFGRKKAPFVYVFSDAAVVVHGVGRISGDFLAAGEHWTALRELLLGVQGAHHPIAAVASFDHTRTAFPSSLPPELASVVVQASARIRADLRVFPCPVVLENDEYQVRFDPIRRSPKLLLPFHVRQDEHEIAAALDLTSTSDPISVVFPESADKARVVAAWPIALLGFADLIGMHASTEDRGRLAAVQHRPRQPVGPRQPDVPRRLPRRTGGRSRPPASSGVLKPTGETAKHQGSFVVGHRRHLPPGQACGYDARAAARIYGIDLDSGWTWVQPHLRVIPADFVLRYSWTVPPALTELAA